MTGYTEIRVLDADGRVLHLALVPHGAGITFPPEREPTVATIQVRELGTTEWEDLLTATADRES